MVQVAGNGRRVLRRYLPRTALRRLQRNVPSCNSRPGPRQPLAIGAQRVLAGFEQPSDCHVANDEALPLQLVAELARCFVRPLDPRNRIARLRVLQQLLQGPRQAGLFFSMRLRPPPGRRRRPAASLSSGASSRWPRTMVLRLRPVICASRVIPPRPHWAARQPTTNRRWRSSSVATTRLIAACSPATSLPGCCWQGRHPHCRMARCWLMPLCSPCLAPPSPAQRSDGEHPSILPRNAQVISVQSLTSQCPFP